MQDRIVSALKAPGFIEKLTTAVRGSSSFDPTAPNFQEATQQRAYQLSAAAINYVTDRGLEVWYGLVQCPIDTIEDSVVKLANFDLEANAIKGSGFLSVYGLKKGNPVCSPIPGVRGIEEVLMKSGIVKSIQSNYVLRQDKFSFVEGGDEDPRLERNLCPDYKAPNDIIAAFCRIVLKDGTKHTVLTPIDASRLEVGRSTPEKAATNIAQRACQRDVIRTYMFDVSRRECVAARGLIELESATYVRGGEDVSAPRLLKAPTENTIEIARNTASVAPVATAAEPKAIEPPKAAEPAPAVTEPAPAKQPPAEPAKPAPQKPAAPAATPPARANPVDAAVANAQKLIDESTRPAPAATPPAPAQSAPEKQPDQKPATRTWGKR